MRSLFQHTLFISLAPLSLCTLISLVGCYLRQLSSDSKLQSNHQNLSFRQDDNNEPQLLIPFFSLIMKSKTPTLDIYDSFSSFFIIMALVNIIYFIGSIGISNFNKIPPFQHQVKKENGPQTPKIVSYSRRGYQKIFKGIIFYGIFSSFYHLTASAYSPTEFLSYPNQEILLSNSFASPDHNLPFPAMMSSKSPFLKEEETISIATLDSLEAPSTPDIRTLSIGKILSTLRLNPDSIILSHGSRLAFIILKVSGALKVIDLSDDQNPIIIGSLELTSLDVQWYEKRMILSADGKTLFATTIEYLEIIDISDPQNPAKTARLEDLLFSGVVISNPHFCTPTMALSSDEKTLYVAGLGLQIFNVSNISHPKILFSMLNSKRPRKVTSLALFPNSTTLLYADETLDFYDVSDPTKPKVTHSYLNPNLPISSIILSKTLKKVYAVGLNWKNSTVMLEEIDISQRDSPRSLGQYQLMNSRFDSPSIVAISPNESNIFVVKEVTVTLAEAPFELIGFDLLKKQIMVQSQNFFFNTMALVMIPGTDKVITNSNNQFQITQLFKNYPNTKTFCLTNNSAKALQFSEKVRLIAPSKDRNILFTLSIDVQSREGYLESYNFTNKTSLPLPLLSSFKLELKAGASPDIQLFIQENSAFIRDSDVLAVLDISNLTNITLQGLTL